MREGKPFIIPALSVCGTSGTLKNPDSMRVEAGEIICSTGYCKMELGSFFCADTGCRKRIDTEGREEGVVFLSCSTAATADIMREIAREMTTSGSTFGACFKHWTNTFMDLRDSAMYPAMVAVRKTSCKTASHLFFHELSLMCKDPPVWAFRCCTCQDKEGRFRVVAVDCIWLGYLKRFAAGAYVHPSEQCSSVKGTVDAASLHPSEWVRRFIRIALKQPSKHIFIKAGQLLSAKRSLALLCPEPLPDELENLSAAKMLGMARLRALLGSVWPLLQACVSLCNAIMVYVRKRPGQRNSTLRSDQVAAHRQTILDLQAWLHGAPRRAGNVQVAHCNAEEAAGGGNAGPVQAQRNEGPGTEAGGGEGAVAEEAAQGKQRHLGGGARVGEGPGMGAAAPGQDHLPGGNAGGGGGVLAKRGLPLA